MAKKKLPAMEDAIRFFKEVMIRASISSYYYENKILLSINKNDNKILIIPDEKLWDVLIQNHRSVKCTCCYCNIPFYAAIGEFDKDEDGDIVSGPGVCEKCKSLHRENLKLHTNIYGLQRYWSEEEKEKWKESLNKEYPTSPLRDILIIELDISKEEDSKLIPWLSYGSNLDENWISIDISEELFTGKIFKININGYNYGIPINRDLMPLKLKKAEFEKISYKVFLTQLPPILAIKKRFDNNVDGYGFTIIRLFQII